VCQVPIRSSKNIRLSVSASIGRYAALLGEAGVSFSQCDGRQSAAEQSRRAAQFKAGLASGLLAGAKSMSEGLSFPKVSNVILFAFTWELDLMLQCVDRAHRLTSEKPLNIWIVLANGTIDGRLEADSAEKRRSAELVLDGRILPMDFHEATAAEYLEAGRAVFKTDAGRTVDEREGAARWEELREGIRCRDKAGRTPPSCGTAHG
jgi:superfamily II DNA or RNA helicase